MKAFCPIRKKRVQEAKNKISRKLYETRELKEKTVNKLVQSEDLRNLVHDFSLTKTQKAKPRSDTRSTGKRTPKASLFEREEKIKAAKEKTRKGYYESQEVFLKVAQRLMDLLGV
jgi:hypothetical protein